MCVCVLYLIILTRRRVCVCVLYLIILTHRRLCDVCVSLYYTYLRLYYTQSYVCKYVCVYMRMRVHAYACMCCDRETMHAVASHTFFTIFLVLFFTLFLRVCCCATPICVCVPMYVASECVSIYIVCVCVCVCVCVYCSLCQTLGG